MGSRLAAAIVLIAALAVLVWIAADPANPAAVPANPNLDPVTSLARDPAADPANPGQVTDLAAPDWSQFPEPDNLGPRLDLVNLDGWLQTDATSLDHFDDKVLLVEIWTFGCHNCKARIPFNQSYYAQFGRDDFEIIGVHAPEFAYEADVDAITEALDRLGVGWPQALDTHKTNFREWQPGRTNYWPRSFVIDQNGDIRFDHIGEGRYEELRETIAYLIDNPPPRP